MAQSHNPYFSRWFSAMMTITKSKTTSTSVTILILVDGFLQYIPIKLKMMMMRSQSLF